MFLQVKNIPPRFLSREDHKKYDCSVMPNEKGTLTSSPPILVVKLQVAWANATTTIAHDHSTLSLLRDRIGAAHAVVPLEEHVVSEDGRSEERGLCEGGGEQLKAV